MISIWKFTKKISLFYFNNALKISSSMKTSSLIELKRWANSRLGLCWWNPNTASYWLLPLFKKIRPEQLSQPHPNRVVKHHSCCSQRIRDRVRVCAAGAGKDLEGNVTKKRDWRILRGCCRRTQSEENELLQEREREKPPKHGKPHSFCVST